MLPAISCSLKSGPAGPTTRGISKRPTCSAGPRAKTHSSPLGRRRFGSTSTDRSIASGGAIVGTAPALRFLTRRWREVISRTRAHFQSRARDLHFNFVIAGRLRSGGRVAEGGLRVKLAADLVECRFDRAVFECRNVRPAGGGGGNFQPGGCHRMVDTLDA